jgi:plastocyanin
MFVMALEISTIRTFATRQEIASTPACWSVVGWPRARWDTRVHVLRLLLFASALLMSACGGTNAGTPASSSLPPTPTSASPPPPPAHATIAITATGFTPTEVTIAVGGHVTFTNVDVRPHDLLGGPDHTRLDCPEVDRVGFIAPGQSRDTAPFSNARTCEFHDHNNLGNPAFQGRIVVR